MYQYNFRTYFRYIYSYRLEKSMNFPFLMGYQLFRRKDILFSIEFST